MCKKIFIQAVHDGVTCSDYQKIVIDDPETKSYIVKMKKKDLVMNCSKCNVSNELFYL